MQILNDKSVAEKTPKLVEHFWTQMEQAVVKMEETLFVRFGMELRKSKGLNQRTFDNFELRNSCLVIPAKAGIQNIQPRTWIPAFAGMTEVR